MQSKFSELENTLKHKKRYLMLQNTELKIILNVFLCSILLKSRFLKCLDMDLGCLTASIQA